MGKVKTALEIALEKAGKIGGLSQEEKEKKEDEEKVMAVMQQYFQGKIDSNGLWQRLKGSKPFQLKIAQILLIDSLGLGNSQEEFQTRKQGILAVETLKETQNTAVIELGLNALEDLQKEYREKKEKVVKDFKRQLEKHPQLRMQPVRTPDGKTVMQMSVSVDEAVKARLSDYLTEHEKQYGQEFLSVIEELKDQVGGC